MDPAGPIFIFYFFYHHFVSHFYKGTGVKSISFFFFHFVVVWVCVHAHVHKLTRHTEHISPLYPGKFPFQAAQRTKTQTVTVMIVLADSSPLKKGT